MAGVWEEMENGLECGCTLLAHVWLKWMPGPETHWHSDSIDLFPTAVYIIKISASTLSLKCFWPFPSVARPFCLWSAVIRHVYTAFHHSSPVWQHTMMWFRGKEESTLPLTLMASIDPVSKCINEYGKINHTRRPCLRMRNINSNISSNINSTWSFEKENRHRSWIWGLFLKSLKWRGDLFHCYFSLFLSFCGAWG